MKTYMNTNYLREIQGERIKECMKLCGITGKYLAEKLNYTPQHISYILNGKRNLTADMAIKLADFFSECLNKPKRHYVSIPYSVLSKEDQEYYKNELNDNGEVTLSFDENIRIDYRYLLGEADFLTLEENFDPPTKETTNYLFQEGIKAILHENGYEMTINMCPDITCFKNIKKYDYFHKGIYQLFYDDQNANEIVNLSTNETLQLNPAELYQLFQDFSSSIMNIINRKFEQQRWESAIKEICSSNNEKIK